jgi:hypothetical protein
VKETMVVSPRAPTSEEQSGFGRAVAVGGRTDVENPLAGESHTPDASAAAAAHLPRIHLPRAFPAVIAGERAAAWRTIAYWWLASRACVFVTGLIVQSVRWPRASWYPSLAERPFALLTAWDGRWYRMVADRGYLVVPGHQSDTAFFPFFPMLLRIGRLLGLPFNASGLVLANVCFLAGLIVLYELNRQWLEDAAAKRASIYLAIFPMGYVFSMVYPEGIVLVAIALAGLLAAKGRWRGAAVVAAVAALTRPEALLLVVPLAALAKRAWGESGPRARAHALTAVLAAPAALGGICLYHWRTFGDPLAFSSAQRAWGRHVSADGLYRAVVELVHAPATNNFWLFRDAAFCVLYVLLLLVALRAGVPRSWVVGSILVVVLPLWSGSFTSEGRFGLLALPAFAGIASITGRRCADLALRSVSLVLLVAATATILLRWP